MANKYYNGFNKHLHIQKDEFIEAIEKASSVNELCKILDKSKPSIYTYAYRFGIPLKGRWATHIRKQDGYYHYENELNHRKVMEKYLGRVLEKRESVHHLDGNKLNNDISNLFLTDWSEHKKIHFSLEKCAFELYKQGFIFFDPVKRKYRIKGK